MVAVPSEQRTLKGCDEGDGQTSVGGNMLGEDENEAAMMLRGDCENKKEKMGQGTEEEEQEKSPRKRSTLSRRDRR